MAASRASASIAPSTLIVLPLALLRTAIAGVPARPAVCAPRISSFRRSVVAGAVVHEAAEHVVALVRGGLDAIEGDASDDEQGHGELRGRWWIDRGGGLWEASAGGTLR